jgi:MoaA/NifB/PqqE/SkfB family radical SAM enzyme
LARADITNVSLFAIAVPDDQPEEQRDGALSVSELLQIGSLLEDIPYQLPVNYVWQVPVLRNPDMTLATQVQQGPRCAEDVAILVEADGSVIPATGPYRSVGNLLRDPWESIWSNPAFRIYRERVAQPEAAESYAQFDHYTETYLKEQAA